MPSHLVLSDQMSDVILKVSHSGYSWRFPAHSTLLCAKSPVFQELIELQKYEDLPIINIMGVQPDTMLQLLKYIYSHEYPTEVTADLLRAAERFRLTDFREHLEEYAIQNLTIEGACHLLESLEMHEPLLEDCVVKASCMSIIESHAYVVFSSDLIFTFGKNTLLKLLESCRLNVPDEAVVFWGIWRWGRRYCCQSNRPLTDEALVEVLTDMLIKIRQSSVLNRERIPDIAWKRFCACLPKRCRYVAPEDSLDLCTTWEPCGSWESLIENQEGETRSLCLQMSFDKSVMLVGITFEICVPDLEKAYFLVFRELDRKELFRQEINCFQCSFRKLSRTSDSEPWLKADVLLSEPLILSGVEIYTVYLQTRGKPCTLPRALPQQQRQRIGSVYGTVHGQAVVAVQRLHLISDVKATWGH
ncbi:uncharacterized protein LOC129969598 [Argiope bruennichi]|uniref:uncharacterized protein LOC129969598 n=1 Tax=Argiope bruennichi TaxID=94029 RepID=UPI0024951122|nr:uncharacterized protein LOC129969598 [Argiope bruennichi]